MDFLLKIFKAVANDHRINMLHTLLNKGELSIEEIANQLRLPYKTTARNLKILEQANLTHSRRWQGSVYYSLNRKEHLEYNGLIFDIIKRRYRKS